MKPPSLKRQFAPVDDSACVVPHLAGDAMLITVRHFLARDVRQKRLGLVPSSIEASELITEFVAMEALTVTHVEIVARHV